MRAVNSVTKKEKANLRRCCRNNFQFADDVLQYRTSQSQARR